MPGNPGTRYFPELAYIWLLEFTQSVMSKVYYTDFRCKPDEGPADKLKRLNRIRLDSFRFLLFMICHFACYLLFVVIMIFLFSTRKPIPPLLSRIYSTSDSSA